jgi:hypothetical protein
MIKALPKTVQAPQVLRTVLLRLVAELPFRLELLLVVALVGVALVGVALAVDPI